MPRSIRKGGKSKCNLDYVTGPLIGERDGFARPLTQHRRRRDFAPHFADLGVHGVLVAGMLKRRGMDPFGC